MDRARTACAIRVLAVLAVCLFLYVLLLVPPESSFEFSDSSGYYEWNGGSSDDPDIKWECNLIVDGNVWWFDANETITLSMAAEYKTSRYSIVRFNLSEVSLRLLTTSGYIPLKETEFSPPLPLDNTTSLSASVVRYYKELVFNVTLTGYEFVSEQIGPKVDGNLQYVVRIATTGFRSQLYTSVLSNYVDPGVSGWTPSEFHVTIDNPTLRQTGVLVFWSAVTVPGLAYLVGRSVRHRSARIATAWASYASSLYWSGMASLGFLIVALTVLTFGPIVSFFLPSGKDWYVALTLLASGVPLTAVVLTLRGSRALEVSLPDQEHKYAEIAEIAGIRYRTQQETADYWSSWDPERVDSETLRLVASVPMFFIYWVESFLLVVMALRFPPGLALRMLLPPLTIICFALLLKSEVASAKVSSGYRMWRTVWSLFWSLLYSQVCPPKKILEETDPMVSLRKGKPPSVSDSHLLQQAFGEQNKRLPDEAKTEEGILTASSIWYVNNVLKQKINRVEDLDAKHALLGIAAHFEAPLTPWRHSLGSAGLVRRMAFLETGTLLSRYAPLFTVDFSQLLLDNQMAGVLAGDLLKSRVAEFHMLFADVPDSLRLDVFKPLRWIQFGWAIASTALGFLVGAVVWRFV